MTPEEIRNRFIQKATDYRTRANQEEDKDKQFAYDISAYTTMSVFNEIFPELPEITYDYKTDIFN